MKPRALLCADHEVLPTEDDIDIVLIPELCVQPRLMIPELGDAEVIMLGLVGGDYSLGEVQRSLRSAGFDPFGVPIVDLREAATSARLRVVLQGALARAEAFVGSGPEHAKPVIPHAVSRRDLLRLPQPEYLAAPEIDSGLCAAGNGCRACVQVCPQTAYSWSGERVEYDKSICEPCGQCVTACPVGAITNPVATPVQLAAQIEAVIAAADSRVGIAFTCRDAGPVVDSEWFPVELPCASMATPQWLMAPLLMGAGAVAARPCSEVGCRLGHDGIVLRNIDYCRVLLEELGTGPDRVGPAPGVIPTPLDPAALDDPFGTSTAPEVLTALAAASERTTVSMPAHPASPVAAVEIDPATCTVCTMCAQSCPTGALDYVQVDGTIEIGFDAASCTACSQCVLRCPEREQGAISFDRRTDLTLLQAGRTVLLSEQTVLCERCGSPIAPAPMMDRITSLLGPEQGGVLAIISRLCIDCRGAS